MRPFIPVSAFFSSLSLSNFPFLSLFHNTASSREEKEALVVLSEGRKEKMLREKKKKNKRGRK